MNRFCITIIAVLFPFVKILSAIPFGDFSLFGTVRNCFSFHSRNGLYDQGGFFYLLPSQTDLNQVGLDLNDEFCSDYSVRFSTLGIEWKQESSFNLSAIIEMDFYGGSDTICHSLRFRKANVKASTNSDSFLSFSVMAGIDWHPMSADVPVMVSPLYGAPFNPYNFSPQLTFDLGLGNHVELVASTLWQNEFQSFGPDGYSTVYIERSQIPELYAGLYLSGNQWNFKAGVDFLQIKPRQKGLFPFTEVYVWVNDKVKNMSIFTYADFTLGTFKLQTKSVLSQSGEHLGLLGGYAWSHYLDNGSCEYTSFSTLSTWVCMSGIIKKFFEPSLFIGFARNLGSDNDIWNYTNSCIYYTLDSYNILNTFSIKPGFEIHLGKINLGVEYSLNNAEYGDINEFDYSKGIAGGETENIISHSITASVSFDF